MKNKFLIIILFIFHVILLELVYSNEEVAPVRFIADSILYNNTDKYLYGSGSVKVIQAPMILTADSVIVDYKLNRIYAYGDVVYKNQNSYGETEVLKTYALEYDYKNKQSSIIEGRIHSGGWIAKGKKIDKINENVYYFDRCELTSCDLVKPHYHFGVKDILIIPNKKILSKNVFFKIGNVPIFYFPYFVKNISDHRRGLSVQMGYSNYSGLYVKNIYKYHSNSNWYGNFEMNYYSRKGLYYKLLHQYRYKKYLYGTLNLNFIHENRIFYDNDLKRYSNTNPDENDTSSLTTNKYLVSWNQHFSLGPLFISGIDFNFQNDEDFNYNYNNQSVVGKDRKYDSNFFIKSTGSYHSFQVEWYRKYVFDSNDTAPKYVVQREYLPKLSLNINLPSFNKYLNITRTWKIYTSLLTNLSHTSTNDYNVENDIYINTSQTTVHLTNSLRLFSPITIVSKLSGLNNYIYNRLNKEKVHSLDNTFGINETLSLYPFRFTTRNNILRSILYNTSLNTLNFRTQFSYKRYYDERFILNPEHQPDKNLYVYLTYNTPNIYLTSNTAIDIDNDSSWNQRLNALNYLNNEITFRFLKNKFNIRSSFQYDLKEDTFINRINNLQVSLDFNFGNYSLFGKTRYINSIIRIPNLNIMNINMSNNMQINLAKKWFIEYYNTITITDLTNKFGDKSIFIPNHTVRLRRDLHCWEASFDLRLNKSSPSADMRYEFWFLFNLKRAKESQIGMYSNSENKVWEFKTDIQKE